MNPVQVLVKQTPDWRNAKLHHFDLTAACRAETVVASAPDGRGCKILKSRENVIPPGTYPDLNLNSLQPR